MEITTPYTFVQQMLVNELEFLNNNVNKSGDKFIHQNHMANELQNLLEILKTVTNADAYLRDCDIKSLMLLLDNQDKINFTYNNDSKQAIKNRLLDLLANGKIIQEKYDHELNKFLNYSIISQIKSANNFEITHIKLASLLCYATVLPMRNSVWYLVSQNENVAKLFVNALDKYLLSLLSMVKNKDPSLSKNVRVVYTFPGAQIKMKEKMNSTLITVDKASYQTKSNDIEVCYVLRNSMQFANSGNQQTELCAQYLELNVVPYCMYNSWLPDNATANVLDLYKLDGSKKKLKLGNVMFVNMLRAGTREAIRHTIDVYYSACNYLDKSKLPFRIIGNYKGYENNYKMAALDFAILMFVTNINNRNLKYLMMNVHENMFQELKTQVCRMPPHKVFSALMNYDINKEPLNNFRNDAIDTAFM
ncbi:hypothetical protein [Epiphyas postvittana nucleopolyhedrovirus]|uniref:Uncharacterized protein n=1 Tax=Epiphyas postvittana nucleopolyhedrovirus TaxID=70600 RepID=Q91GF4_NPVEP|nr:hypothetical protein [Epiphyas postvittana nucleopolyhedrovirus]AAK85664.1 unknown [Epiphyas postvittana nucleopolyhedrovirus]